MGTREDIKDVINKVIEEIDLGKCEIFKIVDRLRDDFNRNTRELEELKREIDITILEVDTLEKLDKKMRQHLVDISKDLENFSENRMQETYEKAMEIRTKYLLMEAKEKELRAKRDMVERNLKEQLASINDANNMVSQINIALGYLKGDILNKVDYGNEEINSKVGIKILQEQERERQRIARDIHDGPAQYIASAVMRIDFCKRVLRQDLERGLCELDDLKGNVNKALKEIRMVLYNLRPLSLEKLGLLDSLKELIEIIKEEKNINFEFEYDEIEEIVEPIIQIAIYRLLQEILNNMKKHSKATRGKLKIELGQELVYIMVMDNGIGFDIKEELNACNKKGTGYGLIGLFERGKTLGGVINIKTSPGAGTAYKIKLPIKGVV